MCECPMQLIENFIDVRFAAGANYRNYRLQKRDNQRMTKFSRHLKSAYRK